MSKSNSNIQPIRICILGNGGSGKSTLADALGRHFNIPAYHLDRELLTGQFERLPLTEQIARHSQLIAGDSWVIDGDFRKMLAARLERANLVIFLNISRPTIISRVIKRHLKSGHAEKYIPENARNDFSWDYIWRVMTRYPRRRKLAELRELCQNYPNIELIVINRGSVKDWVDMIKQTVISL